MTAAQRIMTLDYAIKEGFISQIQNHISEERKCPYIRITEWYDQGEEWMAYKASEMMRENRTDFLLVVDADKQALYRKVEELRLDFIY